MDIEFNKMIFGLEVDVSKSLATYVYTYVSKMLETCVYIYIYIYMAVSHFFRDWQGKEDGPGGTQCPPRPARVFFGPPVFSYVLGVA